MPAFSDPLLLFGLAVGLGFGAVVQWSRLCLVAAVSNAVLVRDLRHAAGWFAAVAVALAATAWLEASATVAVAESGYRNARLDWAGASLGGLVFGIGAMLAGGCAGRTLVGAGEGNGGAWIALIGFALAAYAALFGPLEPLRILLASRTAIQLQAGDASIAALAGWPQALTAGLAAAACAAFAVMLVRRQPDTAAIVGGVLVGILVAVGWWITGTLGPNVFGSSARPDSITFSGPLARVALLAVERKSAGSAFGLGLVAGTLAGSIATAAMRGTLRFTRPPRDQALRSAIGGLLMGVGAGFAGGCNVGHALTGIATLSIKSTIATACILLGMGIQLAWHQRTQMSSLRTPGRASVP